VGSSAGYATLADQNPSSRVPISGWRSGRRLDAPATISWFRPIGPHGHHRLCRWAAREGGNVDRGSGGGYENPAAHGVMLALWREVAPGAAKVEISMLDNGCSADVPGRIYLRRAGGLPRPWEPRPDRSTRSSPRPTVRRPRCRQRLAVAAVLQDPRAPSLITDPCTTRWPTIKNREAHSS
jgi:hypothetical protein